MASNVKTLNRIIELRERSKEDKEVEVKKAFQDLQIEEEKYKGYESALDECFSRLSENNVKNIKNPNELIFIYDYINHLNKKIVGQQKVIDDKSFVLDQKRYELAEAYKGVKTMEKLKYKIVSEANRQSNIRGQKEMDYLYLSRLGR